MATWHGVYIPPFAIEEIPTRSKPELRANLPVLIKQDFHFQTTYVNETKEDRLAKVEEARNYISPISRYLKQFEK